MTTVPSGLLPPPPPLPPPLLPLNSSVKSTVACNEEKSLLDPQTEVRKLCGIVMNRSKLKQSQSLLVHHQPCHPVVQDGPMCGLVALCMAAEILSKPTLDVDDVLERAQHLGYTCQGEMFNAADMCDLASQVIGCQASLCSDSTLQKDFIIQNVSAGNPVLVPYDADGNHEPCLKRGKKSHWAIISGLIFITKGECDLNDFYKPDPVLPYVFHSVSWQPLCKEITDVLLPDIYLLARQGKSRHTGLWLLQSLLESNRNLKELDPKIASNKTEYIIPPGGPAEGLKSQIICLKNHPANYPVQEYTAI